MIKNIHMVKTSEGTKDYSPKSASFCIAVFSVLLSEETIR